VAFLQRLRTLFRGGDAAAGSANALIFYVRCDRCGEVIRLRADRRWDLLQELEDGVGGYSLHKDVLGTQCNALMRMLIRFDPSYKIIHQEIEGGRFASEEAYQTYRAGGRDRPGGG
jgi:hypothetical protein